MKHPTEMKINLEKFHEISEAYEVLSERKLLNVLLILQCIARLKIVYDQHGEDILRLGVLDRHGCKSLLI